MRHVRPTWHRSDPALTRRASATGAYLQIRILDRIACLARSIDRVFDQRYLFELETRSFICGLKPLSSKKQEVHMTTQGSAHEAAPAVSTCREAVGIYAEAKTMETAIDELLLNGFARREISLLAGRKAAEAKLGLTHKSAAELADDPQAPRTDYFCPEALGGAEGALVGGFTYLPRPAPSGSRRASLARRSRPRSPPWRAAASGSSLGRAWRSGLRNGTPRISSLSSRTAASSYG